MNRITTPCAALVVCALLHLPGNARAQSAVPHQDSTAIAAAGYEAGAVAGRTASLKGTIWATAAATFFLTPFVGGVGALLVAHTTSAAPPSGAVIGEGHSLTYQAAFMEGYRTSYQPRYRRAVFTSVVVTSILFLAGAAAFGG